MPWIRSTLLCLLVSVLAAGPLLASEPHRVEADPGLEAIGARVRQLVPGIQDEVEARMGLRPRARPARIVIVNGVTRVREVTGAKVPEWAAGVCVAGRDLIVLRADRILPERPSQSFATVLRHEWVHLTWRRAAGQYAADLPLWFEEGLAEEIGGGHSVDLGARLDLATVFNNLIPFEEIARAWPPGALRAALAYEQGRSFVRFLAKEEGWPFVTRFLRDMAEGKEQAGRPEYRSAFDQLIYHHTGKGWSYWEALWRESAEEAARPWWHLFGRDIFTTLMLAVGVFGLFTFWWFRRRRRREIEALPDDGPIIGQLEE